MTLNARVSPSWFVSPTMQKPASSRLTLGLWCHCHVPSPLQWCFIVHLGPIQSIIHPWIADSNCLQCMTLNTGSPQIDLRLWQCKIGNVLGGFGYMVPLPWLKNSGMVLRHPSITHTNYVVSPDSDGLPYTTLNTGYPRADWCLLPCKKWLHLEWFQVGRYWEVGKITSITSCFHKALLSHALQ